VVAVSFIQKNGQNVFVECGRAGARRGDGGYPHCQTNHRDAQHVKPSWAPRWGKTTVSIIF
jgi:hypothetical protein